MLAVLITCMTACAALPGGAADASGHPGRVRATGFLRSPVLNECSGLARSACSPEHFWTHNDSGDEARLYLIDLQGELLSTIRLRDVVANDWEDIASITMDGHSYLFIGDIGDNKRKRPYVTIYVVEDLCGEAAALDRSEWPVLCAVNVQYADGVHNAEALAADPAEGDVYLITKGKAGECGVYRLPASVWKEPRNGIQTAERIGTVPWKKVTGMDISRDGTTAVVLTYDNAYEYRREDGESWAQAFGKTPVEIVLPYREQGEAVCYGGGRQLILTSENDSAPVWMVDLDAAADYPE